MTLVEICEPIFQYICQLNRSVGSQLDCQQVHHEVESLLAAAKAQAIADPTLVGMWDETELILYFFVDYMIVNSKLNISDEWMGSRLAFNRRDAENLIGDKAFFDMLDKALADRSDSAQQKIAVYFTCMGLGFAGKFQDKPEELQRKMNECTNKIRGMMDMDQGQNICPDAYEHTDDRPLFIKPTRSLVGMSIALIGMIIVLGITMVSLYHSNSKELDKDFKTIITSPQSALMPVNAISRGQVV